MEFDVRGRNLPLSKPLEHLVERRLHSALGRFAADIRRVDVKLADLNGPRGGIDKQCRVEVTLDHGGRVRAEGTEASLRHAIDLAVDRAGRRLGRRRAREGSHRHLARPSRGRVAPTDARPGHRHARVNPRFSAPERAGIAAAAP